MTRFATAFALCHADLVCFSTADDGDTAANLKAVCEMGLGLLGASS